MRRLLLALLFLLGVGYVIWNLAEVEAIGDTFQRGNWRYLSFALVLEIIWLINVAGSYWGIYRAIGLDEKIDTLLLASSGAYFVNVLAPSAGASGLAVFISTARRGGYSTARTTVAGVLYLLFDYAGFICVLTLGLIVLFRRDTLTSVEILASSFFMLIAMFFFGLLYLGMHSANALSTTLAWIARQVNRALKPVIHRQYLSEARAHEFAQEAASGLREVRRKPKELILPIGLALTNKALLITILLLMFMAFNVPLSIGTLIASFSIGYLFLIISPTPAGIGMVEGALTLALSSMYIPLGTAAIVALAYRGITFWFPMALGGLSLRLLDRRWGPNVRPN